MEKNESQEVKWLSQELNASENKLHLYSKAQEKKEFIFNLGSNPLHGDPIINALCIKYGFLSQDSPGPTTDLSHRGWLFFIKWHVTDSTIINVGYNEMYKTFTHFYHLMHLRGKPIAYTLFFSHNLETMNQKTVWHSYLIPSVHFWGILMCTQINTMFGHKC